MKHVDIFTDGACSGNPGVGGWGAILRYGKTEKEMSGGADLTTNNQMEMLAVIKALKILKEPCDITLTTDSQYVVRGMTEWLKDWVMRDWKTASKKSVKGAGFVTPQPPAISIGCVSSLSFFKAGI